MISLFKRLIAWLLEKLANRISDPAQSQQEGYFDKSKEETLQNEIKSLLLSAANSLRKKKTPDSALNGDDSESNDLDNIASADASPRSFQTRLSARLSTCKERVFSVPRWVKLLVIATLPVCTVYIILYLFLVSSPVTNPEDTFRFKKGKPLVRIGYIKEWPTSTVITSLISEAMDTNLNVDITAKPVSQNNLIDLWQLMVTNGADVTPSVWLPDTHAAFIVDAGSAIVDLGAWLEGAKLGLVVPEYMGIDSIEDLAKINGGGVIYGIDPDSKLHHMTRRALELYGLKDYRIIGKSDKYMINKLEEALKNKENIVVAAWTPHWIFGEWRVKMLDDPLKVFGEAEDIHIFVSTDFKHNFPDICAFLSKIKLNLKELSDLMASSRRLNSSANAANKWMLTHKERVLSWTDRENDN